MNHDELRAAIIEHINADDAAHAAIRDGLNQHIEESGPDDPDHDAIVALLNEHIAATEASHDRLVEALDEHIQT